MNRRTDRLWKGLNLCLPLITFALVLTGCNMGNSSPGTASPSGAGENRSPSISGTPPPRATAGTPYSFQPGASDADGDPLSFEITNKPSWATFDSVSGALYGTPTAGDVATTRNIVISVSDGKASASLPVFAIQVRASTTPPPSGNLAPTIAGNPGTTVSVGHAYSFTPAAADANGDSLTFSVINQPAWASLDVTTGRLSGTPAQGDVGTSANITISVSDGQSSTALPPFSIAVNQISTGTATISWVPPTQYTDGSSLTALGGFNIYYGTNPAALDHQEVVSNPGLTRYTVQNLPAATWYFAVRAFSTDGVESDPSNIASKTIL